MERAVESVSQEFLERVFGQAIEALLAVEKTAPESPDGHAVEHGIIIRQLQDQLLLQQRQIEALNATVAYIQEQQSEQQDAWKSEIEHKFSELRADMVARLSPSAPPPPSIAGMPVAPHPFLRPQLLPPQPSPQQVSSLQPQQQSPPHAPSLPRSVSPAAATEVGGTLVVDVELHDSISTVRERIRQIRSVGVCPFFAVLYARREIVDESATFLKDLVISDKVPKLTLQVATRPRQVRRRVGGGWVVKYLDPNSKREKDRTEGIRRAEYDRRYYCREVSLRFRFN
jgi:hypothetical protein